MKIQLNSFLILMKEHKNVTRIMSYNSPASSVKDNFNITCIFGLLLQYLFYVLIYSASYL